MHICHPKYWSNQEGSFPGDYTIITLDDIQNNIWRPRNTEMMDNCMNILKSKPNGIVICPEHCLVRN